MGLDQNQFIKYWETKRKNWKWGYFFSKTTLNITIPIVLIIDLVNFFVVADVKFGFFSINHIWEIIKLLILFSAIITLPYGLFYWYSNELRYQKINRRIEIERKKSIR